MVQETTFEGKVEYFQIIDKDGNVDIALDPDLPKDLLLRMFMGMKFARAFDDKGLKLQRTGRMLTFAPLLGQEASQIGSVAALEKEDWLFPTYRENGSYLYRGVSPSLLYRYWMGSEWGMYIPKETNSYTMIIPIAEQLPHAVGFAWAAKLKKNPIGVLAYCGDGATSEGDFHAALNFGGVFKAPVVFFCQNNGYAISVPRKRQTASKTIAQKALAYGFPGVQVDGNDILAVYSEVKKALDKGKRGEGPTLIEALTYRMGPHTTADDPTRYRTEEEVKYWKDRDPIKRFRIYLENKTYLSRQLEEKMDKEIEELINKAVEEAESKKENPEDIFKYMYSTMPPHLMEQMKEMKQFLK